MLIVKSDTGFRVVDNNQTIANLQVNLNRVIVENLMLEYVDKLLLLLIRRFRNKMYDSVVIELTSDNVDLAEFIRVFLHRESITLSVCDRTHTLTVILNSLRHNSVKVIPIWLGERRKWDRDFVKESADLVRVVIDREINLDKGIPCDTLIVINRPYNESTFAKTIHTREWVLGLDGKQTTNGVVKVVERENIGISYGAFSHMFDLYRDDYDFWFFNEDDYIIDAENYMRNDFEQFREIDNNAGYISESGVCGNFPSSPYPTHVHFGLGFSSRQVLSQLGRLPFMVSNSDSADLHALYGEIPFTNEIYKLGYDLIESRNFECTIEWLNPYDCDSAKIKPFLESMRL